MSEYGLLAGKPSAIILEQNLSITSEPSANDPDLDNITEYKELIGKLIYLTHTRSDISYVIHSLSQFMHSLLRSHLKNDFKASRYLKCSQGIGIHSLKRHN